MSSAYLRLLIFLPAVLIPSCASSRLTFLKMYSVSKLNKQGDNIQPWCIPFPIWNQSIVPYLVLPVASWPAYRFLRRWVRWSGIPISLRIFQFVVIYTVLSNLSSILRNNCCNQYICHHFLYIYMPAQKFCENILRVFKQNIHIILYLFSFPFLGLLYSW